MGELLSEWMGVRKWFHSGTYTHTHTHTFLFSQGTQQGAAAVMTLREATPTSPAYVIAIDGHDIIKVPLLKAVEMVRDEFG